MKIMERKYRCKNGVTERTRYPAGDRASARGSRKKGNTAFRKQEANFNSAIRKGARILNCNYSAENGYFIGLDYDQAGLGKLLAKAGIETEEYLRTVGTLAEEMEQETAELLGRIKAAAEHELRLWLRRVRRTCGEVKIFAVTGEIDGETGEIKRVHHHAVLQFAEQTNRMELMEKMQKLWKHGAEDVRTLRNMPDYTPVAVYLLRQVIVRKDEKKYIVSRGMEQPEVSEREIIINNELKAPPGANVLERAAYSDDNVMQYVRYIPKKRERRKKHEISEVPGDEPDV